MTAEQIGTCMFCGKPVYVDITDEEGNYPKAPGYEEDPYSGLCYVLVHTYSDEYLCPIAHHEGEHLGLIYDTKEDAIAAWNRRTEPIGNPDELPGWMKKEIDYEIYRLKLYSDDEIYYIEDRVRWDVAVSKLEWVLSLKKPEADHE